MAPSEYWHIYACPFAVRIDLPDFIPSFNAQTLTLGKIFLLWGQPDTGTGFPVTQLMLCPSEYSRCIWTMPLLMAFDFWLVLMCSGGWTLWYSKIPTNPSYSKTPDFSLLRNQRNHPAKYASKNFVCCPVATCVDKSLLFFSAIPC